MFVVVVVVVVVVFALLASIASIAPGLNSALASSGNRPLPKVISTCWGSSPSALSSRIDEPRRFTAPPGGFWETTTVEESFAALSTVSTPSGVGVVAMLS